MSLPIPQSVAEITPPWLEEVLRSGGAITNQHVRNVRLRPIGAGVGFLSSVAVVEIDYDPPAPEAPSSTVVKLEPASEEFRSTERRSRAFEREVRFYLDLAPRVDVRIPRVYFAHSSPEGSVLVMEDLTRFESGDQVRGIRHAQAIATVRQIALLHAAFWKSGELAALEWLPDHDHFWVDGFEENWPGFAREYEVRLGREALALGERVLRHRQWLLDEIAQRPSTITHSDLRADNLMFGPADSPDATIILDWQLVTRSMAANDPTRLLGGSEPAAERNGHHLELFIAWHEALIEAGVRNYEYEEALRDFRLGALFNLLIPVKAHFLMTNNSAIRPARLMDAQAERMYVSALELGAAALLPQD